MAASGSDRSVTVLPVTTPQQLAQFREVTRKYLVSTTPLGRPVAHKSATWRLIDVTVM